LDAADQREVVLRAVGGVAVSLRCPSARREPLRRGYKDLDLVGRSGEAGAIGALMADLGYQADREFNVLHGHQRLYFWDAANQRQLDVFIDNFEMCHRLDLKDRLDLERRTLPLADLLLTKLQVVELNEKDVKDAAAILADHDLAPKAIDSERIVSLLGSDWGWWRTTTENLGKLRDYATSLGDLEEAGAITERLNRLMRRIEETPKSVKWKLRARVGERVRWYDLPEEVDA
ncbi:MAG: hypothetical protein ACRDJ2_15735, partial [Actinomycetota bacterium]